MPMRGLFHQTLALKLFKRLILGAPVSMQSLALDMNCAKELVQSALDELPAVYFNSNGDVESFWGLAINYKSPHVLIINGESTNTWCAWDALFIPSLVGERAEVKLTCPVTDHVNQLKLGREGITETSNEKAVISFIVPDERTINSIPNFCHYIHGFKSKEYFERWRADGKRKECFSLTLQEAFELGALKNQYQYGDVL